MLIVHKSHESQVWNNVRAILLCLFHTFPESPKEEFVTRSKPNKHGETPYFCQEHQFTVFVKGDEYRLDWHEGMEPRRIVAKEQVICSLTEIFTYSTVVTEDSRKWVLFDDLYR